MTTSRSGFHDPRRAGFTLVELVVLIVLLGFLFVVVIAALGVNHEPKANALLQQGANFAKALLVTDLQGQFQGDIYPASTSTNHFATSTDYFKYVIGKQVVTGADYSLFGGGGASPVATTDPAKFRARNNAWSVVVDAKTSKNDQIPLLISRNLVLPDNRLPDGTLNEKGDNLRVLIENSPDQQLSTSRTHLFIITRSASGNAVYAAKDLGPGNAHRLNPTSHRLPVLRP